MTNSAALIKSSIWRKPEFRSLPRLAQCTYLQLLGLKDIDRAGLFSLNLRQMVRGCDELTPQALWLDLQTLEEQRWVFVDEDTDEGFIRHYMRTFEVWKYPQYMANAFKGARMVESEKIRVELAAELRSLRRAEASAVADEIDPLGTVPPPSGNGESGVDSSVTVDAPASKSVSSSASRDLLVSSHFGEDSPRCSKHLNDQDPPSCWACKRKREAMEQHAVAAVETQRSALAERRRLELDCPICHGTKWIPDTDPAVKCDHQVVANA